MGAERQVHLAVDLGASGGRVLAGLYDGARIELRELIRFPNEPVREPDGLHWNLDLLFKNIKHGIALAVKQYGKSVVSLGVDTWGVDYGLLDANGKLLTAPFLYRDNRTQGMQELAFSKMPREEIYQRTGIQFMFFNTLFQLLAETKTPERFARARHLLFMPDLIHFMLTGFSGNEKSIASTSQLLNPRTQRWDFELIRSMGFPEEIFGNLIDAGATLGNLSAEVARETGAGNIRVVAPPGHDTASAVVGTPADEEEPVFLSSGTWSLFGRELAQPLISPASYEASFSNEGGVFGTTRFLKNIAGMWLLQESKRAWDIAGNSITYGELISSAETATPFEAFVDPNASDFDAPKDMPGAIVSFCKRTGQTVPADYGAFTRMILESLALKYRSVRDALVQATGKPVSRLNIIGGGCQNELLNQFTADALNAPVIAGPVEATSLGNIVMQLSGLGEIRSLAEGRALIQRSFPTKTYLPQNPTAWDEATERFNRILS